MIPIFLRQIAAGIVLLIGFIIAAYQVFIDRAGAGIGMLLIFTFIASAIAPHPDDFERARKSARDFTNSKD